MSRRIFLDSSFWITLRDPDEPRHRQAQKILQTILEEKQTMVITTLILAETHAYFAKAPARSRQILDDYEYNQALVTEQVTPQDEKAAVGLLRQHRDKKYSFCDAVSFLLMRRLGIRRAAAFDQLFRQFGEFEVIC